MNVPQAGPAPQRPQKRKPAQKHAHPYGAKRNAMRIEIHWPPEFAAMVRSRALQLGFVRPGEYLKGLAEAEMKKGQRRGKVS